MHETISAIKLQSKHVNIFKTQLHYLEAGIGDPILFLHGVPTSSYVWRKIIPYLSNLGRCVALDLPGFGDSAKPAIEYSIFDYIKYVNQFIETLNLKNITLVMHGWGSLIGFDYAMRNESNCKGLVFYEAFIRPLCDDFSLPLQEQLSELQSADAEFDVAVHGDLFVDKIVSQSIIKQLTHEEMNQYKKPFIEQGSGKPLAQYMKELLQKPDKDKVNDLINSYMKKLIKSSLPKLMLYSIPGFITSIATIMWAKEHLSHLEIIEIGEELHLAQEAYPEQIGETISVWLQGVEQNI